VEARVELLGEAAEMFEVMAFGAVERSHEQEAVVITFCGLM
jgi:hypothetical protein